MCATTEEQRGSFASFVSTFVLSRYNNLEAVVVKCVIQEKMCFVLDENILPIRKMCFIFNVFIA